jgi:hypothetical protein
MTRNVTLLVARDTIIAVLSLALLIAFLLWGAWEVDFGITRTTFLRLVWIIVLFGFAVFLLLYIVLVWTQRAAHYTGRRPSDLHPPLIASTAALAAYFGIQSIAAVDYFVYPDHSWPLLMDPTVRILGSTLILAIVLSKSWMTWEILPTGRWTWNRNRKNKKPPRYPARRS